MIGFFVLYEKIIKRFVSMIKIVKEEIESEKSLVSKLNVICDFYNTSLKMKMVV